MNSSTCTGDIKPSEEYNCAAYLQSTLNQPGGINEIYRRLYELGYHHLAKKLSETYYTDIANKLDDGTEISDIEVKRQINLLLTPQLIGHI